MVVKKAAKRSIKSLKPARKTTGKVSAKKTKSVKKAATKTVAAKAAKTPTARNELGFKVGSDLQIAYDEMVKGAVDRRAMHHHLVEVFKDRKTATGGNKPISTIMNQVETRARLNGYRIESSWKLVGPEGGVQDLKTEYTQQKKDEASTLPPTMPLTKKEKAPSNVKPLKRAGAKKNVKSMKRVRKAA